MSTHNLLRNPLVACLAGTLLAAFAGCPVGGGGGGLPDNGVDFLDSTDAVLGSTGRVRIFLLNPASGDTKVQLTSSNPAVVQVPGSVTVAASSIFADVEYSALSLGTVQITGTLDGTSDSVFVDVQPTIQLEPDSQTENLQTGATTSNFVSLNMTAPTDVVVDISSNNPAVVSVPPTLTIRAFSSGESLPITAAAEGSAIITASFGGTTQTTNVFVRSTPVLSFLSVSNTFQTGAVFDVFVGTDIILATDTIVTLSSTSPGVVNLPTSLTITAGSSGGSAQAVASAEGSTTITAQLGASTLADQVSVVTNPSVDFLFVQPDDRVVQGQPVTLSISLNASVASNADVLLTSNNPAVASVPAAVTIPIGNSSVNVPVTINSPGSVVMTATLGGSSRTQAISILAAASLTGISAPNRLLVGQSDTLRVFTDAAAQGDQVVTLTSTNPAVLAVPGTLNIPGGETGSLDVNIAGLATGTTTLTATLGASTQTLDVTVVDAPTLTSINLSSRVQTGLRSSLSIQTDVGPTTDTLITLTSTDPSVLAVPPTMLLQADNTFASIPMTAGSPGETLITATLGASGQSQLLIVVPAPTVTFVNPNPSGRLQTGVVGSIFASFDASSAADTVVAYTSNAAGVVSVNPSDLMTAGGTFSSSTFQAVAPGFATVTASAFGSSRSTLIEVVAAPTTVSVSFFPTPKIGHRTTCQVFVDAVLANATTVTLMQTNPAALQIPATVIIPANEDSVAFDVTGLANAATTVTATVGAISGNGTTTPVP
jgi:hypothetical protein